MLNYQRPHKPQSNNVPLRPFKMGECQFVTDLPHNRLPRLIAQEVMRVIERKGFILVRQSGSYKIFRNSEGTRITLPFHSGENVSQSLEWV